MSSEIKVNKITTSSGSTLEFGDTEGTVVKLNKYSETVNSIGSTGGGTQDIDLNSGSVVTATVDTSANTFTF